MARRGHGGACAREEDRGGAVEKHADAKEGSELVDNAQDVLGKERLWEKRVGRRHAVRAVCDRGLVLRQGGVAEDVPANEHCQELVLRKSQEVRSPYTVKFL